MTGHRNYPPPRIALPTPPRHKVLLMHFALPIPFDIPDDIWHAAGIAAWQPSAPAYFATAYRDALSNRPHEDLPIELVPIGHSAPPQNNGVARFLVDDRPLVVLQAFATGVPLPAVLGQRPGDDPAADVQLVDGAHRFYAPAAAGFTHLPVAIRSARPVPRSRRVISPASAVGPRRPHVVDSPDSGRSRVTADGR